MAWTIKFDKKAAKDLEKLDKVTQKQIEKFILKLSKLKNPRKEGQALKGNLKLFWRYRVGNYRLMCTIEDHVLMVVIIYIKHRKDIYKSNG